MGGINKTVNIDFTQAGAGNLKKSFTEINQGLELVKKAVRAVKLGFDALRRGAALKDAEASFRRMGGSVKDLDRQLKLLGGTVTKGTLIQQQNMSRALGVTKKQFEALLPIARAASKVLGVDVKTSLQDLNIGLARGSKKILDNQGLMVNFTKAQEDFAKSLGKVRSGLTAAEVAQANLNEVQRAGKVLIASAPVSSLGEDYDRLAVSVGNATDKMIRFAAEFAAFLLLGHRDPSRKSQISQKFLKERAIRNRLVQVGASDKAIENANRRLAQTKQAILSLSGESTVQRRAQLSASGQTLGEFGSFLGGAASGLLETGVKASEAGAFKGGRIEDFRKARGPGRRRAEEGGVGLRGLFGPSLDLLATPFEELGTEFKEGGRRQEAFDEQKASQFADAVARARDALAATNAEMAPLNASLAILNEPVGNSVIRAAQSMESAFASAAVAAIMMGEGFTDALNQALQSIAIEAGVRALFNTAMAFAFTSMGQHGSAIAALAAAKGFAAVAVIAGVGAAATGGFGGGSRGAGGPSAPSAAGEREFGNGGGGGGGSRTVVINATFEVDGEQLARQSIIHRDRASRSRGI